METSQSPHDTRLWPIDEDSDFDQHLIRRLAEYLGRAHGIVSNGSIEAVENAIRFMEQRHVGQ
jgi:hypothetical protein